MSSPLLALPPHTKNIATRKGVLNTTESSERRNKMNATLVFRIGGGLRINGFFFYGGEWFKVLKGAVSLRRIGGDAALLLKQDYAAEVRGYYGSLIKKGSSSPVVASGKSPLPELSLRQMGGSHDKMRDILTRMGKIA